MDQEHDDDDQEYDAVDQEHDEEDQDEYDPEPLLSTLWLSKLLNSSQRYVVCKS